MFGFKKIPYLRIQKFFQPLCHSCYNFHGYSVNYVIVKHFACSGVFFFLHKKRPIRVCVCGGGMGLLAEIFFRGVGPCLKPSHVYYNHFTTTSDLCQG